MTSQHRRVRSLHCSLWLGLWLLAAALLTGCVAVSRHLTTDLAASATNAADPGHVDTKIFVADAAMGAGEDGKIDLNLVTESIYAAIRGSESFSEVVSGACTADYAIVPTVVKLTDIFDNVVHLRVQVRNCVSGAVLYDHLFIGSAFTQSGSLKIIAKILSEEAPAIRAAIHGDMQHASSLSR